MLAPALLAFRTDPVAAAMPAEATSLVAPEPPRGASDVAIASEGEGCERQGDTSTIRPHGLLRCAVHMRITKAWPHPGSDELEGENTISPGPARGSSSPDGGQDASEAAPVQLLTRQDFEVAIIPLVPRLYRLCIALTGSRDQAEDLLQTSLLKAYQRRASYAGRGNFAAWLGGVIRHEHDEIIRRTARRRSLLDRALQEVYNLFDTLSGVPAPDPESWTSSHEQAALLLECVHELPEPYRTAVWLCDIEELTYEEVAEMLSIPIGTVKSRHARGRKQLRRNLERRGGTS